MAPRPPAEVYADYKVVFEAAVADAVKRLLEGKHLYQSVTVAVPDQKAAAESVWEDARPTTLESLSRILVMPWNLLDPHSGQRAATNAVNISFPDIKIHCWACERLEPFNFVSAEDFLERRRSARYVEKGSEIRVLVLSYECQSCKGTPDVFMVRCSGIRMTLCGRAPMETIQVPPVIPKTVAGRFAGAIVAYQSGQTLPANFMLRVLIEEFARSQVETTFERADELMDAYMAGLPQAVRENFPSLRAVYGALSADMHGAVGASEVFAQAAADIERHFDARRLFKVVERRS